jgi:hypothetical protein
MNLNRYRIDGDKYIFHTFSQGQKFNSSVWLENDGRFIKKNIGTEDEPIMIYATYYNEDGSINVIKEQELDKAQVLADWKIERQNKVDNIEVLYNGVIYQGDEVSQGRMSVAINGLPDDTTTIPWVAKDNTVTPLNRLQLKEILLDAGTQQSLVWNLNRPTGGE